MCRSISLLFTGIFLVLFACTMSNPKLISVDPKFKAYVAGYSSGLQSRADGFRIQLQSPVDSTILRKKDAKSLTDPVLLEDLFEISPSVEGQAVWVNEREIQFVPTHPLASNTLYTVSMKLEELAQVQKGCEEFNFQVATIEQKIYVHNTQIALMDDYNIDYYTLTGSIIFSDLPDTNHLNQILHAKLNGQSIRVNSLIARDQKNYTFQVDSIKRSELQQTLLLSWNGQPVQSASKGEENIKIPSVHDYSVTSAVINDEYDQTISITFSEPLDTYQDLNGIIDLKGVEGETFSVTHNQVTVYLPNRLEGTFSLNVAKSVKNTKRHTMEKSFSQELTFDPSPPRVRIQGEGSILPDSRGLIFPFETIGLKSVTVRIQKIYENNVHHFLQVNNLNGSDELTRFGKTLVEKSVDLKLTKTESKKWNMHVLNLEKWIRPEQGAIYRIAIKFDKKDATCDCPDPEEEEETNEDEEDEYYDYESEEAANEPETDPNWSEQLWRSYYWDRGYDTYDYNNFESPCSARYYSGKAQVRNILASNIGVIFKLDEDKKAHAFLTDLISAQPLSGVEVKYMDYTQQLIVSGISDELGMVTMDLPRKPFLLVAKKGKQRAYLKLGDGYSNSMSKFEVDGEKIQNDIKGYIYGERGVWRPGDSLYLNFILNDPLRKLPKNHPVQFTLTNPDNQVVYKTVLTRSFQNHYDFRTATSSNAPTGNYLATVSIGHQQFTKNIKIETVKPNRLKMKLDFDTDAKNDTCIFEGAWLTGAPAKGLRATVSADLRAVKTTFDGFRGYYFDSPLRNGRSHNLTMFDSPLDKVGKGKFALKMGTIDDAPGMMKAVYTTRVFEQSGNFSIDRTTQAYSPFEQYVGLGIPSDSRNNMLVAGKKHAFKVAVVDPSGKRIQKESHCRVKVYELEWQWWYEQGDEDMVDFLGRNSTRLVFDTLLPVKKGDGQFKFGIAEQSYGRFLVVVDNLESKHQTGQVVMIENPYWSRSNNRENEFASMLQFSCDKATYTKGESVKISFPSPSAGKALISIETRKRVVKRFWVDTKKGETQCSFTADATMAPNAYVHVTLIQPHSATTNDLPIRLYGVAPILVDDPSTHLHPVIRVPDVWKPETTASVSVKEQFGQAMTYTLAIVDDGLLDLTRFKTPNAWPSFFAKEALGVRTWDMYKDVIGAYSGKLDRLLSIGGDMDADDGAGQKANRFKPVVHFLGPFSLSAGSSKTHKIDLPNYIGSVRVMVVAHNEKAFGSSEETVLVKKPLMVLGTLPRTLAIGEKLALPVTVFAMEKFVQNVEISVSVQGPLKLLSPAKSKLQFDEIGDAVVNFDLEVAERIGVAKVIITAKSGNESASHVIEIDVQSPNPIVVESELAVLKPGQGKWFSVPQDGVPGSHKLLLELSPTPPINLTGRMDELIHYPYGCIEQTTSSVLPQLLALEVMDFNEKEKKTMSRNIKAGLKRLQSFQTAEGGFAYWPGQRNSNEWGSNYAGHFILLAEQKGYSLPINLKSNWMKYQKSKAQEWQNEGAYIAHGYANESNQIIQSYRLYTLALAGNPELGAMNRMREIGNLTVNAKWRLAGAYYLAGQYEIARKMTNNFTTKVPKYNELSYSYGSDLRDKAMILEVAKMLDYSIAEGLQIEIANKLSSNDWLSTQETGYCLLAVAGKQSVSKTKIQAYVSGMGSAGSSLLSERAIFNKTYEESEWKNSQKIYLENKGQSTLYVVCSVEKIPKRGNEKTENKELYMTVTYKNSNGSIIDPRRIEQGTDFFVEVSLRNPTKDVLYREMCLQQLFPSGWEIHNTRLFDEEENVAQFYQDIRDDRVYSFFDIGPGQTKTIRIQLNASYKGNYYLPAIYSEAMYKRSIHAQKKGYWVEVI